jgi:hypothetical protein
MFLALLLVTFVVATVVSLIVAWVFAKPADQILRRIISDEISAAWHRYIIFALFVVGVSSGVRVWDLEKYITNPQFGNAEIVQLTSDRWILEVYRTIIETLQGLAWVLLVFFVVALFAYLVVRIFEHRNVKNEPKS